MIILIENFCFTFREDMWIWEEVVWMDQTLCFACLFLSISEWFSRRIFTSRSLRQRDSSSHLLSIIVMNALSHILGATVGGGMLSGFTMGGIRMV